LRTEGSSSVAATIRRPELRAPFLAVLLGIALVAAVGVTLGLAFAGSPAKLSEGIHIAGVDVGGLTARQARGLLERRFQRLRGTPVSFVADGRRFELTPAQLGIEVDWAAAVEAARREGEGFGPVRGLRRIQTRIFGADVAPPAEVSEAALSYTLREIARQVDRPARSAALRFDGLDPRIVPAATGRKLDRDAGAEVLVRALAAFARSPVGLPLQVTPPGVTGPDLEEALEQARLAVSAPVRLDLARTRWRLTRPRLTGMIALPSGGQTELAVGGRRAERFLERVAKLLDRPAVDAGFRIRADGTVRVAPGVVGREVDRPGTARAILGAALSETNRVARVKVRTVRPERTAAEARAMGITGTLAAYSTSYAGSADRIHNLQLAVSLLDGTLVAPGGTFSLNEAVGERTAERGFRVAPVIVGSEYEEAVGGGVSQVATTIFNAAWEAGLKITERNPHALYISRYPLGRDATVNYPNLDLKFVNDTKKWILVKGWSTGSGITVALYGAPTGRRVVSEAGSLTVSGSPPVERTADPTLLVGERVVEATGEPPRSIKVTRRVYLASGELLYDETWSTNYRGEKRLVRVGTKPKPPPKETKPATTQATTETQPQTQPPPGQ
jgi:vancomycin resistance protein YoaR